MQKVTSCPGCGGHSFRPYSQTVEAERQPTDLHYAQDRCTDCDLVFSNPVADGDELARYYARQYYEQRRDEFAADRPELADSVRRRAADEAAGLRGSVLPYVPGGTFFEIGAAYGALLAGARELGFAVSGVEPSAAAVRVASDVLGVDVRHGMFDAEQWPASWCDVVYSHHVIEHVHDLRAFVRGIRRLLKPGGLTVIGTENHHNAWVATRRVRSWVRGRRLPEFQTSTEHTLYFCQHSLAAVLRQEGFDVVRTLVYTHALEIKLRNARFRTPLSRLAFYALHYADVLPRRGNRLLVWARSRA